MTAIELHYSRSRLAKMALFGIALLALAVWTVSADIGTSSSGGRYASLVEAIGPQGVQAFAWFLLAAALVILTGTLRLLFSKNLLAARATPAGLEVRTWFRTRRHSWSRMEPVAMRRVNNHGEHLLVQFNSIGANGTSSIIHHLFQRSFGLAANTLEEEEGEIEAWIADANALRERCSTTGL